MTFSVESRCRIENKIFFIGPDKVQKRGRALLREKNRDNWYVLSLEPQLVVWVRDAIDMLIDRPNNQKFFLRKECENGICWVQKVTNKRGSFVEVTKVLNNGEKSYLFIPSGVNKDGWRDFIKLIDGKFEDHEEMKVPKKQAFIRKDTSYADVVEKKVHEEAPRYFVKKIMKEEIENISVLNLKTTIVVTRKCFHDDWGRVLKNIKKCLRIEKFEINPFHPDKALLLCPDKKVAENLCHNQFWCTFEEITLKFEFWDTIKHGRMDLIPSYGGWIKVRNIPLIYWELEAFKAIGDMCGGFIKCSKNSLNRIGSFEVAIQVKENYCGFIPAEVEVKNSDGRGFMAEIVNFQEWKHLERRFPAIHGTFSRQAVAKFFGDGKDDDPCPMDIKRMEWKSSGFNLPRANQNCQNEETVYHCQKSLSVMGSDQGLLANIPVHGTFHRTFLEKESTFEVGTTSHSENAICRELLLTDGVEKDDSVYYLNQSEEDSVNRRTLRRVDASEVVGKDPTNSSQYQIKKAKHVKENVWTVADNGLKGPNQSQKENFKQSKKVSFREKALTKVFFKESKINHTNVMKKGPETDSDPDFYNSSEHAYIEEEESTDKEQTLSFDGIPEDFFENRSQEVEGTEEEREAEGLIQLGSEKEEMSADKVKQGVVNSIMDIVIVPETQEPLEVMSHQQTSEDKEEGLTENEEEGTFIVFKDNIGEKRMKLADWLRSSDSYIAPNRRKSQKKKGMTPSKDAKGQRELKNLRSSINYERSKHLYLQRAIDVVNEDS